MNVSQGVELLHIATVSAVIAWLLFVVYRAAGDEREGGSRSKKAVAVVVPFMLITGLAASFGALSAPPGDLPLGLPVMLLTTIGTIFFATTRFGTRLVEWGSWGWLIGYQVFRIPVEIMLAQLYVEGALPVEMSFHGWNFDVLSGLLALPVAWLAARGNRKIVWAWNIMGLLLLITIVSIAVMATETPFQVLETNPPNRVPFTFPFIWLPYIEVQAALFGHILVFRMLLRDQKKPAEAAPASTPELDET